MIDGGANIGLASVVFANRWPAAEILAVELDASNASLAQANLASYPGVKVIHAGLWKESTLLAVENPVDQAWAFRATTVTPHGTGSVPGVRIPDLLDGAGWPTVDIIKLDIEGAEIEVLGDSRGWLPRTRCLLVELHDRFRPGCQDALEAALAGGDWHVEPSGEYLVAWRREWPTSEAS